MYRLATAQKYYDMNMDDYYRSLGVDPDALFLKSLRIYEPMKT